MPAMAGELIRGRALATRGDRVVAAQAVYGSGTRDDPRASIRPSAGSPSRRPSRALWPALIPARSDGTVGDDRRQPDRRAPSATCRRSPCRRSAGLLLLLFGYIALIGPINYLVLRRLDRREWAWITMPILIVGFAARRVRLRVGPPRQQHHRQRGRHRPRRAGRDRRHAPRCISASSRRPAARTRSPFRAARSCRRRSPATCSAGQRASLDVLQGDPVAGPRPGGRVRVAADDPGRSRRRSCRRSTPSSPSSTGR